jgi:hypothetical protein
VRAIARKPGWARTRCAGVLAADGPPRYQRPTQGSIVDAAESPSLKQDSYRLKDRDLGRVPRLTPATETHQPQGRADPFSSAATRSTLGPPLTAADPQVAV